jgi:hypothetical protein
MKWRVMLELVGPDGVVGVHEVGGRAGRCCTDDRVAQRRDTAGCDTMRPTQSVV